MAKSNNLQLVHDKKKDMRLLFKRMDDDKKLAILDPFEMKNLDGQKTPDVINVTMNEAMVFLDRAKAIMNGANMQRIVFGRDLDDKQATTIENFYEDIYYDVDQRFTNSRYTSLYGFLIEQLLGRGSTVARCLMREDGDEFVPDITGFDSRYFTFENDSTGMMWGAPFTWQTKAQILRDYGIALHGKTRGAAITDFWNDEVNEIYIADSLFLGGSQTLDPEKHPERIFEHGLGYAPFVYTQSGAGLQSFMDDGIIEHQGESVFAPNRGLLPHLNHAASIFLTLTDMSFEGSLALKKEEPGTGDKPKNPFGRRKVIELGINEGFSLIPINDVKNATRLFYNMLVGALQRGALPNIDYGGLSFPLSAVAISKLTASKDAIFIPRLNALAYMYRALSRMIKDQYVKGGYMVELGEEGREREYPASDIDKKFGTEYRFHSVSPEQDIANYAIGQAAMAIGVPRITVFTDVIKFNDPAGQINLAREEKVEAGDFAQTLYAAMHQQIEAGKDVQARMTLQQLLPILRARAAGSTVGLAPQAGGLGAGLDAARQMVPLLGEGTSGGGAPPADGTISEGEEADNDQQRREETVSRSRETADAR